MPNTLTLAQYNTRSDDEDEDDDIDLPRNLDNFLNSLFDPWPGPFAVNPGQLFRAGLVNLIKAEETDNSDVSPICWLVDNATVTLLVDILEGYWNNQVVRVNPSPRIIETDRSFIRCVRDYIGNNNLQMRVPAFNCKTKRGNAPSTYEWAEDRVYSFKDENNQWNSAVVRIFLRHLLAGAHFVVVHSANDLGNNVNLPSFFKKFSDLGTKYAGHSHYTAGIALTGVNYPELTLVTTEDGTLDEIQDSDDAVLLPVVLCDTTTNPLYHYNSFFQMEGWRPGKNMYGLKSPYNNKALVGGYRHGADFNTHQETLWNISTYGASLFSEKRGAPIFLAPQSWMDKKTHVYAGFSGPKAGHAWFKADLVTGLP
ncbi:hypothetical protein [Archangium sp.]|uniref:hypothetical protein n=1 Tax=Archangium sp. TaxID=1872627 RepID=UPI00286D4455|nr:hypothetical protein [Archangium sp.]